ncbi:NAD-dependent epimerase/dehydratase family protein (plasmid) [Agrobacterium tumefaciens]|nr:NAD-dependent epimerase/dehydratase family protein [Agrobacterium tumefaciens]WIE41828.1 NAD-dependent epimerase/dehydratase family protein [Agrobacterium tumefaciens]
MKTAPVLSWRPLTAPVFAGSIHLSTESVLATGKPLVNVDETMLLPLKPAGGYSRTKAVAERIALAANADDFAVVVLRPRFVWGRDDTTALPALTEAVKSGKFAWISGGTYLTSTTHIGNLCKLPTTRSLCWSRLLRQCKASPYKTLHGRRPRRFFQLLRSHQG